MFKNAEEKMMLTYTFTKTSKAEVARFKFFKIVPKNRETCIVNYF